MSTRAYTHVKELLPEMQRLKSEGYTHQEIANTLNLQNKMIVRKSFERARKRERNMEAGQPPKQRGRKPAVTLQDYKYECKRLNMENELLRDFLHLAGRR